jgi:tRNA nucleotidyltransferase (CCA-adding enzyme)
MSLKKVLAELDIAPSGEDMKDLKEGTEKVVGALKEELKKVRQAKEVVVGGSFAKGTLAKSEVYDVDIFVRFDWRQDDISKLLENGVKKVGRKLKLKFKTVHGSRDYFSLSNGRIEFEIIPVSKIKHPREARNVTDLSYFHVNYVRRKLKGNLVKELLLAKQFCEAQGFYGAESYIQGFSGYGLECLIIYYGSFEKMLRALVKVEDRLILDPGKMYKKNGDVLFELNESKLHSPIILVDPTWKERNALAALGKESFRRFQGVAKKLLGKPGVKYFEVGKLDLSRMKKMKGELLHLSLETDRQEGDIAGTKLKKFSGFLERQLGKYFKIVEREFRYDERKSADLYLVLKSKGEVVRKGPPVKMKEASEKFRKANKGVFEKKGMLYLKEKVDFTGEEFVREWVGENKKVLKGMGITGVEI